MEAREWHSVSQASTNGTLGRSSVYSTFLDADLSLERSRKNRSRWCHLDAQSRIGATLFHIPIFCIEPRGPDWEPTHKIEIIRLRTTNNINGCPHLMV